MIKELKFLLHFLLKRKEYFLFAILIFSFFTYYKENGFNNKGANLLMLIGLILFLAIYNSSASKVNEIAEKIVLILTEKKNKRKSNKMKLSKKQLNNILKEEIKELEKDYNQINEIWEEDKKNQ